MQTPVYHKLVSHLAKNAIRAQLTRSPWFDPILSTLYVTPMCNLRCTYCDDFGAHRNDQFRGQALSLDGFKRAIDMLADETIGLYLTGGEPTLNPDLVEILRHARPRFMYVAMNTNAICLRDHDGILGLLDNLVISVDSMHEGRRDDVLAAQPDNIRKLFENVRWAAAQQRARGFTLTVTSVLRPGRLDEARAVRDFCFEIGAEFSPQHLSDHDRMPSRDLQADADFRRFMEELIAARSDGKPVSGSVNYLRGVRDQAPYQCTPTAAPHVDWRGHLAYPCRELPDHIWVDMLAAGSYRSALDEAASKWGAPPNDCSRCGERCYVELSTLVRNPLAGARESVGYVASAARNHLTRLLGPRA